MYRTHTCGELRLENAGQSVCLSGWVQKIRNLGAMTFIDLRDRYGITQLVAEESANEEIKAKVAELGREFVIQVEGKVVERASKNNKIPTGEVEIILNRVNILSRSEIPPFTIEDNTDGGDEIRMRYRYLDLRRQAVRKNLELRHRMAHIVRNYLDSQQFMEVET
ncbi:MAG: aspartate--tRNA ligase, partial [Odoribacter sp.]|nr:aspartate--tRNA ligase [Odoribacter sp.]